jgi:hypothetical protein
MGSGDGGSGAGRSARVRVLALLAAAGTVGAGLGVRAMLDGDAAKYAGDALYTVLLYALVAVAAPRVRPAVAAGIAVAASWAVEFAQLTGIPEELAQRSTVARLVLGSTFNAPDLGWYAVGAAGAWLVHGALRRRVGRPQPAAVGRPAERVR